MKLRLGPLPRTDSIKISVSLGVELKERLDRYAKAHSQIWGEEVTGADLIPHILETFLRSDRAFKKLSAAAHTASRELPG
jgi:hypothetical protein